MSKHWQDFWVFAFLAVAYLFTIVACWRLLWRPDVSEAAKVRAAVVLVLWVVVIPVTLIVLGAGPDLVRMLAAPFAQ